MKYNYKPKNNLEKFGLKVYSALVENFSQTFFVGGTVRDLLLKKSVYDVDIATEAKPEQVVGILKKYFIETNIGFSNMGVILALDNTHTVSVSTLRKDLIAKDRYPKVKFIKDIKIDAQRRDFTINSLYLSPKNSQIIDLHNGLQDLKNKKIKFIGSPQKRIEQDPLRIIRALRFALVLNFKIEKQSYQAIKKNVNLILNLTQSRLEKEINKIKSRAEQKILREVITNPQLLDKYFK